MWLDAFYHKSKCHVFLLRSSVVENFFISQNCALSSGFCYSTMFPFLLLSLGFLELVNFFSTMLVLHLAFKSILTVSHLTHHLLCWHKVMIMVGRDCLGHYSHLLLNSSWILTSISLQSWYLFYRGSFSKMRLAMVL